MSEELKGTSRPRAIRVAFLVQRCEHEALILDGIFADSYSRWGGRFSLIVPCHDNRIMDSYWPWLEAFDPDLVYSYVPLSDEDVQTIHERIDPAQYAVDPARADRRLDAAGFMPRYPFPPLSSLSTIFKLSRNAPPRPSSSGLRIIDQWDRHKPSRFLTDNFGTYQRCQGTNFFPNDAKPAALLRTIMAPPDDPITTPGDIHPIPDELSAFREFVSGALTSMSILSSRFVSRNNIRAGLWSTSFNLVIGDTLEDRIIFWNARLLIPSWLDADMCGLRVTLEQLEDADFLTVLVTFLQQRNFVNDGTGGQSQVVIRSASVSEDELKKAAERIIEAGRWLIVKYESVTPHDMIPHDDAVAGSSPTRVDGEELFGPSEWSTFTWSAPIAFPDTVAPRHLSDAPLRQQFTRGYWAIDFSFGQPGPGPGMRPANRLMLPKRWHTAGAFKATLKGDAMRARLPFSRASRDFHYSIFVEPDYPLESITVPTPIQALEHALTYLGRLREPGRVIPPQRASWMRPSNEARNLQGVLGLMGGLRRAAHYLLHPFMRKVFTQLGGARNYSDSELKPTISRLRKRALSKPLFDLSDDDERQALSKLIRDSAATLKTPATFVRYDALKASWDEYLADFGRSIDQTSDPMDDVDWDDFEQRSLDNCLAELRRTGVLFQGHHWKCSQCHHNNWVDFSKLSSDLTCEVCKSQTQAPIEIPWLFRANEFLIRALRERGTLPLIWALSLLSRNTHSSFVYVEPIEFGFGDYGNPPEAEADLLVFMDGFPGLCEVKASWGRLRKADIEKLVDLAMKLRPKVAILAIMSGERKYQDEIAAATTTLNAAGIDFLLLTADDQYLYNSPYLYLDDD